MGAEKPLNMLIAKSPVMHLATDVNLAQLSSDYI